MTPKEIYVIENANTKFNKIYFKSYPNGLTIDEVESKLDRLEEIEKVLGIIKETSLNVYVLLKCNCFNNYKEYKDFYNKNEKELGEDRYDLGKLLTETEFNLLKEDLK